MLWTLEASSKSGTKRWLVTGSSFRSKKFHVIRNKDVQHCPSKSFLVCSFNPDPTERHSWWTVIIGGFFTHIAVYGVNQAQVQRYVSMDSYKSAACALLLSCPILVLFMSSLCFVGLCLFYYYKDCDPVK